MIQFNSGNCGYIGWCEILTWLNNIPSTTQNVYLQIRRVSHTAQLWFVEAPLVCPRVSQRVFLTMAFSQPNLPLFYGVLSTVQSLSEVHWIFLSPPQFAHMVYVFLTVAFL